MHQAKSLGISGVTAFSGVDSIGTHGRRHSARFFELADQPIEYGELGAQAVVPP